jgi:hypothetical protein
MTLPATFAASREADGALVLWDGTRTVRAITVSVGGDADGLPVPPDAMLGEPSGESEVLAGRVMLDLGREFVEEIDGRHVTSVAVTAAAENRLLSIFFHANTPGLEEWAHAVARTIRA